MIVVVTVVKEIKKVKKKVIFGSDNNDNSITKYGGGKM